MAASSVFTATPSVTRLTHSSQYPKIRNDVVNFSVKCMKSQDQQTNSTKVVSTKFSDVLAFGGPAPERINGRLAMIGFVSAMAVELSSGQDVLTQISNGGGVAVFVGTSVVLSLASLVPLFKGVRAESKSNGVMTSDAELWNGRLAMMGLVASFGSHRVCQRKCTCMINYYDDRCKKQLIFVLQYVDTFPSGNLRSKELTVGILVDFHGVRRHSRWDVGRRRTELSNDRGAVAVAVEGVL
ncbi:hypothetical protein SSX86_022042 [Deinandra increscens subsp. villosa]|uniref:Early light-induced protein n=1 Tax=Deinandra increscens subsp. villosa TaxID=3103831 RepID=A0AAP0CSJ5_9ASTR